MDEIVNKIANSGLINFDLETLMPEGERAELDIKDQLWQGLALKEKDFRTFVKNHDWPTYTGKYVAVYCSADAIIPSWAYMLVSSSLQPYAKRVVLGTPQVLETLLFREAIDQLDLTPYTDGKVIVKGCSKKAVPTDAYLYLVQRLQPVVASLMFGEACSTVPVYKRPKQV
jgi:hypothetical protein